MTTWVRARTSGRSSEGRYGVRYDPAAVQMVLKMISASRGESMLVQVGQRVVPEKLSQDVTPATT